MQHAKYSAPDAQSTSFDLGADQPIAERFTALERVWDRRDRRWLLVADVDDEPIELSGRELYDYNDFRARALEQRGIGLPSCSLDDWETLVGERIRGMGKGWRV